MVDKKVGNGEQQRGISRCNMGIKALTNMCKSQMQKALLCLLYDYLMTRYVQGIPERVPTRERNVVVVMLPGTN